MAGGAIKIEERKGVVGNCRGRRNRSGEKTHRERKNEVIGHPLRATFKEDDPETTWCGVTQASQHLWFPC